MPGVAVLEVARQMAEALAALETAGTLHGDLSLRTVWIDNRGFVQLAYHGVRAVMKPNEDFARPELPPDAYDYLAPERADDRRAANVSSDLFSCACVWWHLAAGRPPFGGGTSRGKVRAVQAAKMAELKRFAPTRRRRSSRHLRPARVRMCLGGPGHFRHWQICWDRQMRPGAELSPVFMAKSAAANAESRGHCRKQFAHGMRRPGWQRWRAVQWLSRPLPGH